MFEKNPIEHITFTYSQMDLENSDISRLTYSIYSEMVDKTNESLIKAIIKSAEEAGITDLYLLDKNFILEAIREKMDRENEKEKKNMAKFDGIKLSYKTRLCQVGDEIGDFHCWEQFSTVIEPGIAVGSHPGGQIAQMYGIVEFPDSVRRVDPTKIKFVDEDNADLAVVNEFYNDRKRGEQNGN